MTTAPSQFERDLYCLGCAGFLVIERLFDDAFIAALLQQGTAFEDEVETFARDVAPVSLRHSWPLRTTRALYAVGQVFQDLIMHDLVQRFAQTYLDGAVVRDCLMQTNMPDERNVARGPAGALSFHRDTKWDSAEVRPMYLHAFALLHDFTRANGSTVVVPGTHRAREPGYYFKDSDPRTSQPGIDYRVYEQRYFPSAVHVEAPRGSLVLLDPMTIHTQGINVTAKPRSLINVTFRAAAIRGRPALLNARGIASRRSRVPLRADLLPLLEDSAELPDSFGPLRASG